MTYYPDLAPNDYFDREWAYRLAAVGWLDPAYPFPRGKVPDDVLKKLAAGEDVDPALYYMRTAPLFETGDPRYAWLNRLICVGTGARRKNSVHLEVFEVK